MTSLAETMCLMAQGAGVVCPTWGSNWEACELIIAMSYPESGGEMESMHILNVLFYVKT